jgi:hypothetical protein
VLKLRLIPKHIIDNINFQDSAAGLVAAAMIAIVPGYISRSVAGSYDNEGIFFPLAPNIFAKLLFVCVRYCHFLYAPHLLHVD